jgi:cytochrome o ubiquinol oxidase subunit II
MKKTNRKHKLILLIACVLVLALIVSAIGYLHHTNIAVLNPKGPIAQKELNLIIVALLLSLLIVIPVFTLTIVFAWRYREGNTKAKYSPELDHNRTAETMWWLIPSALILVLAIVAWNSSHELDPYKPLVSNIRPLTIQVVALDWKWLFIYPQQNVASVNFFQFPSQTPINFEITSDAPMNSFWIPQLGGQIYAMPGMSTQLHLLASSDGSYSGSSANISGVGFSGMNFIAKATSKSDFNNWLESIKNSSSQLSLSRYNKLANPSENNPPSYYSAPQYGLFNIIVNRYLIPPSSNGTVQNYTQPISMPGMEMQ